MVNNYINRINYIMIIVKKNIDHVFYIRDDKKQKENYKNLFNQMNK